MDAKQKMEEAALREQQQLADIEAAMGGEEVTSDGFDYTSLVNAPELKEGMIPITYNETKGEWEVADKSNPNKSWYDYDNKKWANICTVSDSINNDTEKAYRTADVGTTIPEEDMTTMFVWIPRYAYSIVDGYQTPNTETPATTNAKSTNKMDIKFLVGNTNRDIDNNTYPTDYTLTENMTTTPMIVHPGFTYGNTQLTGFWIAKFEASGTRVDDGTTYAVGNHTLINGSLTKKNPETNTPVKILPNVISWRNLTIGESEYRCMQMANNTATYGWTNANTHLIKNSEWGAVAYLCYSKYGAVPSKNGAGKNGANVWYDLYTGAGPKNGKSNDDGYYSYVGNEGTQAYNQENGELASTTGNVYGVYDMSGGAHERVAAYLDNGNNNLNRFGNSSSNSSIKYFENGVLKSEYTNLWDKYEVGNEEKLAIGNNKAITIDENEKLSQGELWNGNKTDKKYIQARFNLTQSTFNNMQQYKGIGVNEMTNTFSFYTTIAYKKNTESSDMLTRWGWFAEVNTAAGRASGTSSADQNTAWSWNQDIVRIGHASIPFVYRGGYVSYTAYAGVLCTDSTSGGAYDDGGFRPALCP